MNHVDPTFPSWTHFLQFKHSTDKNSELIQQAVTTDFNLATKKKKINHHSMND
jgi:hypothetical protein